MKNGCDGNDAPGPDQVLDGLVEMLNESIRLAADTERALRSACASAADPSSPASRYRRFRKLDAT